MRECMSLHVLPPRSRTRRLADLVARYDGRAPRYTSYPTAVQFGPQVDAETYRGWLGALPTDQSVSLYAHIPFCSRLCWYCGCNTRAVTRHQPVGEYVELLLQEIASLRAALPGRLMARHIHFGGGSPNMLTLEELEAILAAFGGAFALGDDLEIAAELDPAGVSADWARGAARLGLTRASLGVQTLDPKVQAAINRHDSIEQVAATVGWLRDAGVRSINIDLLYGLPHQTTVDTLATVEAVLRLAPERIALFGYAHVPWMKVHQKLIEDEALPPPLARLEQSEAAAARLLAEGYVRVGLDHFARADDAMALALERGELRRNFQGYTVDEADTLLGVGASSIGRLPQGYVQNAAQEVAWRAAIRQGGLAATRGVAMSAKDRFVGEIIERLMCDLAVDLEAVCAKHDRQLPELAPVFGRLSSFIVDGLLRLSDARLEVIGDGRLVVRSICAAFDPYLDSAAERHSQAI